MPFVSKLITIVAVCPDLQFEDSVFVGIVLDLEELNEVPLHKHVLAHLTLGQVLPRDGDFVGCIGLGVVVDGSDGDQKVLGCTMIQFVDEEPDNITFGVVLQDYSIIETVLSTQYSCEVSPKYGLWRDELLRLHGRFDVQFGIFAIILDLDVSLPGLLILIELIGHSMSLILQIFHLLNHLFVLLRQLILQTDIKSLIMDVFLFLLTNYFSQLLHFSLKLRQIQQIFLRDLPFFHGRHFLTFHLMEQLFILAVPVLDSVHTIHNLHRLVLFLSTKLLHRKDFLSQFFILMGKLLDLGLIAYHFFLIGSHRGLQSRSFTFQIQKLLSKSGQFCLNILHLILNAQALRVDLLSACPRTLRLLSLLQLLHEAVLKLQFLLRCLQLRALESIIAGLIGTRLLLLHEDVDLVFETQDVLPKNTILLLHAVVDSLKFPYISDVAKFAGQLLLLLLGLPLHQQNINIHLTYKGKLSLQLARMIMVGVCGVSV